MRLSTIALRSLAQRPGRTLLTIGGVALSIAALVTLLGLTRGIERTLLASLDTRGTDAMISEPGAIDILSSIVPEALADRIAQLPGVDDATAELARLAPLDGISVPVVAWPHGSYLWTTLEYVDGRGPEPGDTEVTVVGRRLAERFELSVGDEIELLYQPFRVIGIVGSESVLNLNLIHMLLADMQQAAFREGQATVVHIRLDEDLDTAERQAVMDRIADAAPGLDLAESASFSRDHALAGLANALSWSISLVALVMAVMGIVNTLTMSVNERRREIVIMRAVGWPPGRIVVCIVMEGLIITACGGAIGTVLGVLGAEAIALIPAVEGFVQPELSWSLVAWAFAGTIALGLAAPVLPAIRAASLQPAVVLRGG